MSADNAKTIDRFFNEIFFKTIDIFLDKEDKQTSLLGAIRIEFRILYTTGNDGHHRINVIGVVLFFTGDALY